MMPWHSASRCDPALRVPYLVFTEQQTMPVPVCSLHVRLLRVPGGISFSILERQRTGSDAPKILRSRSCCISIHSTNQGAIFGDSLHVGRARWRWLRYARRKLLISKGSFIGSGARCRVASEHHEGSGLHHEHENTLDCWDRWIR